MSNFEQTSQNSYLNHLIDISFQGVNRLCVLVFEKVTDKTAHKKYYLPKAEIRDCIMIDGKNFFDQLF